MTLPPPHRNTASTAALIIVIAAPLLPPCCIDRRAPARPTSLNLAGHLTATHSPSPITRTSYIHDPQSRLQMSSPNETIDTGSAPNWPPGPAVSAGHVPELSDHNRGFLQPRPAQIAGGRGMGHWSTETKRKGEARNGTTDFITVILHTVRGIISGAIMTDPSPSASSPPRPLATPAQQTHWLPHPA